MFIIGVISYLVSVAIAAVVFGKLMTVYGEKFLGKEDDVTMWSIFWPMILIFAIFFGFATGLRELVRLGRKL